ncbi:MAG: EamA family transporter, partial [Anaerolineales bacterium]|nr:EamA family transporter [Anaerolineales bacterium]
MKRTSLPMRWLLVAGLAQMGWGGYPVFLRYLQTVSHIPGLSLLAVGNVVVLLLVGIMLWPRLDKRVFRLPIVWLFGMMVVLRGITNLLANRYTLSIFTQLIYLMTPFLVAMMSRLFLREALPKYTMRALTLALIGAVLMMSSKMGSVVTETAVSRNDPLGIGLAVTSAFMLAIYMILVRRSTKHKVPGEALLIVHLVSLAAFSFAAGLIFREDWQQWQQLG